MLILKTEHLRYISIEKYLGQSYDNLSGLYQQVGSEDELEVLVSDLISKTQVLQEKLQRFMDQEKLVADYDNGHEPPESSYESQSSNTKKYRLNKPIHPLAYFPVIYWNWASRITEDNRFYKVQRVHERSSFVRSFQIPNEDCDFNIQFWILDKTKHLTTELGIEQRNKTIKTFSFCTDNFYEDGYYDCRHIMWSQPEENTRIRVQFCKKLDVTPGITELKVKISEDKVQGFINGAHFSEIITDFNIEHVLFGIEVYKPKEVNFTANIIYDRPLRTLRAGRFSELSRMASNLRRD